jgi:hypothetical protein
MKVTEYTSNIGQTNQQTPWHTNWIGDDDLELISVVRLGIQVLN